MRLTSTRLSLTLYLFAGLILLCLHLAEGEKRRESRLETQRAWKIEQAKPQSVAKQLYVDGK